jgi:hypothetical protein
VRQQRCRHRTHVTIGTIKRRRPPPVTVPTLLVDDTVA